MSDKITATFGADVSEVEAKMLQATRATAAYERAVKGIDAANGKSAASGGDLTKSLSQSNEQLAKGLNLLKGGAAAVGIATVIGKMQEFSNYAKELGKSASEAQKSAAKWGEEFAVFGNTIKGAGASVLGTLAGWGRDIGDKFRDPMDVAYDDVAKSSEEMAVRQEAALAKSKAAHERAAAEIPALIAKLDAAKYKTENVGRDEEAIAQDEKLQIEKQLDALAKSGKNGSVAEAERIKLEIQLEEKKSKIKELEAEHQKKREADAANVAKKNSDAVIAQAKVISELKKKHIDEEAKAKEEADKMEYDRKWESATKEQKMAQALKEGQAAHAENMFERSEASRLKLEQARAKYLALLEGKDAPAGGGKGGMSGEPGRERGADGKLRKNGVVISEEDAARTDKTKAMNQITSENKGVEPVDILKRIEELLKPKGE